MNLLANSENSMRFGKVKTARAFDQRNCFTDQTNNQSQSQSRGATGAARIKDDSKYRLYEVPTPYMPYNPPAKATREITEPPQQST